MMRPMGCVVFIQGRPHRAGAQTCLARLLGHERLKALNPVLVSGGRGWLTEECERLGVPVLVRRFPGSRSLWSRFIGNALFAREVAQGIASMGMRPAIVHANDHIEGLLALGIARAAGAKSAVFLRSPRMTRRDYFKYGCGHFDLVAPVCDLMKEKADAWDGKKASRLIYDTIRADEFGPARDKPATFPMRLLVVGSAEERKGWADFTEALYMLSQKAPLPPLELDFTGIMPDPAENDLKLGRLRGVKCRFLGRVEGFRWLVLGYDLVVNPSRDECFATAALEVVAAGVPILTSTAGQVGRLPLPGHMFFRPGDPADLARALGRLMTGWDGLDMDVSACQAEIARNFSLDRSVDGLIRAYEGLDRVA